jgi:hypothetical protein
MLLPGKRLLSVAWLAAAMAGFAASPPARAQPEPSAPPARTEAELAAGRKLFAEALHDEDEGRFDVALDEFRRVLEVRDTAAVEYHIGTCLEGLGHFVDALSAYGAAAKLSDGDRAAADVAAGSRERIDSLSKRVGHLTLALSSHAPPGAEARVDGRPAAPNEDIILDPGDHHVEATAPGAAPFQSDISLPEGGCATLTLSLDPPLPPPLPLPLPLPAPPPKEERASGPDQGSRTTWGWISLGTGGALLAGSVVGFVLREKDIGIANQDCPNGGCRRAVYAEAQSATSRARTEGPLAWALGAAGVAAAGLGAYLVLIAPNDARAMTLGATAWRGGAGIELRGAL